MAAAFLKRLLRRERPQPEATAPPDGPRDAAELETDLSAERLESIVAGVREYAIFLLDPRGNVISWNAGAARIKGYTAEEIIGRNFATFYPSDAIKRGWPADELRLAALSGRIEDEGWRLRKDGSRFWAHVVITALYDKKGGLRGYLKITSDLTQRKMAEDALRASEERFRLLVDGVTDYAIFMLDPDGFVTTWNIGAERIKGYTAGEIVGQHFSRFYTEEAIATRWPHRELELAEEQGHFEDEGWRVRKDGSQFWASVVITALRDQQGQLRGFAKVTRDLTSRKHAEEELRTAHAQVEQRVIERTAALKRTNDQLVAEIDQRRRAEAQLRRVQDELHHRVEELATADRRKDEFLAMLGHELRNPLAPMRTAVELLRSGSVDDQRREWATGVFERQLHQIVGLVDDLLDVSRIMRGLVELRRERMNVALAIERAVETARPAIEEGHHELHVSEPEEPLEVDADPIRLAQVLANILLNAAKYSDRPGRIWLRTERLGEAVVITVRDEGVGIPAELLPQVFDLFVQGEQTLARSRGGLGIGLTLVRRLVEMHGGTVTLASPGVGQGTEVTIRLPLAASPVAGDPAAEGSQPAAAIEPAVNGRRTILVVDDNEDAADTLAEVLRLHGHEVRTAYDGERALVCLRERPAEVVLLDLGLPGINGFDVAQRLQREPALRPRLLAALSGYGQEEDRRRTRDAGFDLHLTKPVAPATLAELIDRLGEPREAGVS